MVDHLTIEALNRHCEEREEESTILEFKSCNELVPGTTMGKDRERQAEDIRVELSKDVSAMLNSAGGTIIYGIRENNSRASKLDTGNVFSRSDKRNIRPEQVTQWIRSNVQPPPTIDVYRISLDSNNPDSGWFIVIAVPQGQTAYRAKDGRFYKRVVSTLQIMEQYEVADVMNRLKGADLVARVTLDSSPTDSVPKHELYRFGIRIELSSGNLVASEAGALKVTVVRPLDWGDDKGLLRTAEFQREAMASQLPDGTHARAKSAMLRWGAHQANIIFPGTWYGFNGRLINLKAPSREQLHWPTYMFQIELFTLNSAPKMLQYAIGQVNPEPGDRDIFKLTHVDETNRSDIEDAFLQTYVRARKSHLVPVD